MNTRALCLLTFTVSCASSTSSHMAPPSVDKTFTAELEKLDQQSAAGVTNPELAKLLREHWRASMKNSPLWASQLGLKAYNSQIGDSSAEALKARKIQTAAFAKAAEQIHLDALNASDRVTHRLLKEFLGNSMAAEVCQFEQWSLNPRSNPLTRWNYLATLHKVNSLKDGEDLVARYRAIPESIDAEIANLRRGAAQKFFANAESTRRIIEMLRKQLVQKLDEWPLMAPTTVKHEKWDATQLKKFQSNVSAAVTDEIKPAFQRYHDFLKSEILPNARSNDAPGLASLPMGEKCYAARITNFTNLNQSAQEIHEIGLREIKKINNEMRVLGNKLFGMEDLPTILKTLRTDPKLYFDTEEEVENKARTALAGARKKMPDFFGILPKADCIVTRIPDYEAPYTTIAYYRPPIPDGSKPGEYFINVYKPKTRPRYEAEALAFHEAIPGHHLQIAISQELPALPSFRKHLGMTAFVEGWALYTERLSDEMGLYTGDLDRMGMLSYDSWRAARLVVDTGLHAMGWSREKAVQFMLNHTALAENNIRNEVDRYITWPGQALGYKIGQLFIFKLRAWAKSQLGENFDIKIFHDTVIGAGAVTMSIVEERVQAWVTAEKASSN